MQDFSFSCKSVDIAKKIKADWKKLIDSSLHKVAYWREFPIPLFNSLFKHLYSEQHEACYLISFLESIDKGHCSLFGHLIHHGSTSNVLRLLEVLEKTCSHQEIWDLFISVTNVYNKHVLFSPRYFIGVTIARTFFVKLGNFSSQCHLMKISEDLSSLSKEARMRRFSGKIAYILSQEKVYYLVDHEICFQSKKVKEEDLQTLHQIFPTEEAIFSLLGFDDVSALKKILSIIDHPLYAPLVYFDFFKKIAQHQPPSTVFHFMDLGGINGWSFGHEILCAWSPLALKYIEWLKSLSVQLPEQNFFHLLNTKAKVDKKPKYLISSLIVDNQDDACNQAWLSLFEDLIFAKSPQLLGEQLFVILSDNGANFEKFNYVAELASYSSKKNAFKQCLALLDRLYENKIFSFEQMMVLLGMKTIYGDHVGNYIAHGQDGEALIGYFLLLDKLKKHTIEGNCKTAERKIESLLLQKSLGRTITDWTIKYQKADTLFDILKYQYLPAAELSKFHSNELKNKILNHIFSLTGAKKTKALQLASQEGSHLYAVMSHVHSFEIISPQLLTIRRILAQSQQAHAEKTAMPHTGYAIENTDNPPSYSALQTHRVTAVTTPVAHNAQSYFLYPSVYPSMTSLPPQSSNQNPYYFSVQEPFLVSPPSSVTPTMPDLISFAPTAPPPSTVFFYPIYTVPPTNTGLDQDRILSVSNQAIAESASPWSNSNTTDNLPHPVTFFKPAPQQRASQVDLIDFTSPSASPNTKNLENQGEIILSSDPTARSSNVQTMTKPEIQYPSLRLFPKPPKEDPVWLEMPEAPTHEISNANPNQKKQSQLIC